MLLEYIDSLYIKTFNAASMRPANKILERHYGKNFQQANSDQNANNPVNSSQNLQQTPLAHQQEQTPFGNAQEHNNAPSNMAPQQTYDGGNPYLYPSQASQQDSMNQQKLALLTEFNCNQNYVRLTTNVFPKTNKLQRELHVPLAAIIQPYGNISHIEPYPLAHFGTNGIVRCESCRSYINPYCEFIDCGTKWRCNICGKVDGVASNYICETNSDGERTDKYKRPELHQGSYDIKAGADYMARPPVPPVYFFIIDVSKASIETGMLEMTVNTLKEVVLNDLFPGEQRTQIGIITYDSSVHFYNMKAGLKQPQVIVVTDFDDLFLPIPDDLLINVSESKDLLLNLLDSMVNMYSKNTSTQSVLTHALSSALKIFKHVGGKFLIFQSSPGLINEPQLQNKNATAEKKSLLIPSNPYFSNLCAEIHHFFISCSIFCFSDTYRNFITLAELARYLNGEIYYYPDALSRQHKLYYELKHQLTKDLTWESVFRIRISAGWNVKEIIGNYSIKSSDLLSVQNVDESRTYMYEFEINDSVARNDCFFIQTALLYTTAKGERRIRVHNYGAVVSNVLSEIYSNIEPSCLAICLARQAVYKIYKNPVPGEIKTQIIQRVIDILRQFQSTKSPLLTSNLPENLRTFAFNMLGVMKHKVFSTEIEPSADMDHRNSLRISMLGLPVDNNILNFVPYLFDINSLSEELVSVYEDSGTFIYPPLLPLRFTSIQQDGIYLMDDGVNLTMYLGQNVNPTILNNVFGVTNISQVAQFNEDMMYHNSADPINTKIYNLLTELRAKKVNKYAFLHIVKAGERSPYEMNFFYKLIEDKLDAEKGGYPLSLVDFFKMLMI